MAVLGEPASDSLFIVNPSRADNLSSITRGENHGFFKLRRCAQRDNGVSQLGGRKRNALAQCDGRCQVSLGRTNS